MTSRPPPAPQDGDGAEPTPINDSVRHSHPGFSDSTRQLSSSIGQREPIRSFIHGPNRDYLGKPSLLRQLISHLLTGHDSSHRQC